MCPPSPLIPSSITQVLGTHSLNRASPCVGLQQVYFPLLLCDWCVTVRPEQTVLYTHLGAGFKAGISEQTFFSLSEGEIQTCVLNTTFFRTQKKAPRKLNSLKETGSWHPLSSEHKIFPQVRISLEAPPSPRSPTKAAMHFSKTHQELRG